MSFIYLLCHPLHLADIKPTIYQLLTNQGGGFMGSNPLVALNFLFRLKMLLVKLLTQCEDYFTHFIILNC